MSCIRRCVRITVVAAITATLVLAIPAAGQSCASRWDATFAETGARDQVWSMVEFDDGSGPALYVGGTFTEIGAERAWGVARWDGRRWTSLGEGLKHGAGGGFAFALCVWDDGTGPALCVGGRFTSAGGVPAQNVARWDGRQWRALGSGTNAEVFGLGTYDDGRGEALYVGGRFTRAGGLPSEQVARWDGQSWEPLGAGVSRGAVIGAGAFAVFDDGEGAKLYVGGDFTRAGDTDAHYLARWDGQVWDSVRGWEVQFESSAHIDGMIVHDDGAGPALFITGYVRQAELAPGFLKWDGQAWSAPGGGLVSATAGNHPDAIGVLGERDQLTLWIGGGAFRTDVNGLYTTVATWDGESYGIPADRPSSWVNDLVAANDGFGPALYFGGSFQRMSSGAPALAVARWSVPNMALEHTPLRAGQHAIFRTTCSTPAQRVYFTYSTRGLGALFVPQLNVRLDLDRPHLGGFSIANEQGKASLVRRLPPDSSGQSVFLQAAERGRKSEVVEALIE